MEMMSGKMSAMEECGFFDLIFLPLIEGTPQGRQTGVTFLATQKKVTS
jgi:hypothetical protein